MAIKLKCDVTSISAKGLLRLESADSPNSVLIEINGEYIEFSCKDIIDAIHSITKKDKTSYTHLYPPGTR